MKYLCDTYIINISEIVSEKITMIELRWKQLAAAAQVRSLLNAIVVGILHGPSQHLPA